LIAIPHCHWTLPGRDDLRPFAANPRGFRDRGAPGVPPAEAGSVLNERRNAGLKGRSTRGQIAANPGRFRDRCVPPAEAGSLLQHPNNAALKRRSTTRRFPAIAGRSSSQTAKGSNPVAATRLVKFSTRTRGSRPGLDSPPPLRGSFDCGLEILFLCRIAHPVATQSLKSLGDDKDQGTLSRQNTAFSGKLPPLMGRIRQGFVYARLAPSSLRFAANSGTASHQIKANSHVWNILAGVQSGSHHREVVSYLVSITYVFAATSSSPLTPYSRIFCRQVSAGQPLASHPRKIFKTSDFKLNDFNILQNIVGNLLKTNIYIFYFLV
jgi:hypothetical protein